MRFRVEGLTSGNLANVSFAVWVLRKFRISFLAAKFNSLLGFLSGAASKPVDDTAAWMAGLSAAIATTAPSAR